MFSEKFHTLVPLQGASLVHPLVPLQGPSLVATLRGLITGYATFTSKLNGGKLRGFIAFKGS